MDKLVIKRGSDGSCVFLYHISNTYLCGLQHMKPKTCKLWPFKVLSKPEFRYGNEAVYYYGGNKFFIYADSTCSGVRYGKPTREFTNCTLKEFAEIALGLVIINPRQPRTLVFSSLMPGLEFEHKNRNELGLRSFSWISTTFPTSNAVSLIRVCSGSLTLPFDIVISRALF